MTIRDKDKWDARYRDGRASDEPSSFLVDCADLLPTRGRALDVAAGGGRHGLWLARRGLDTTLVDISEQGLAIARRRADATGLRIATVMRDLDEGLPPGSWHVIASLNFLDRALFSQFAGALAPGGLLVFAQPTATNLERHKMPSRSFLLEPGELPGLATGLDVLRYREDWTPDGRHEARLVARKPMGTPSDALD